MVNFVGQEHHGAYQQHHKEMDKKKISIAVGFEFEYNGQRHEHTFWSISDLQNYFRWESERAQLVGYDKAVIIGNNRSTKGVLKLIAMDAEGTRKKEVPFATYIEMVKFIEQKKIRIGKY
jgi:hypothetical protein